MFINIGFVLCMFYFLERHWWMLREITYFCIISNIICEYSYMCFLPTFEIVLWMELSIYGKFLVELLSQWIYNIYTYITKIFYSKIKSMYTSISTEWHCLLPPLFPNILGKRVITPLVNLYWLVMKSNKFIALKKICIFLFFFLFYTIVYTCPLYIFLQSVFLSWIYNTVADFCIYN